MIQHLVNAQLAGTQTWHVELSGARSADDRGRLRAGKVFQVLRVIAQTLWRRATTGAEILYYPPSSEFRATVRDALVLASTRWAFRGVVFHFHAGGLSETLDRWPRWLGPLARCAFDSPDLAIQVSALAPADGEAVHAKRTMVIPYGLPDRPAAPPVSARPMPLRILFAGVLCESKGVLTILHALAMLRDDGLDVRATFAGPWQSSDFEHRVQHLVREKSLDGFVSFPGALHGDRYLRLFDEAHAFCFPTFFESETFGLVVLEAMRAGVPVVAARWRGVADLVRDGETGFLVEPHNVCAVAERLRDLLNDPGRSLAMGTAARRVFEQEYRLATFLLRMHDVLRGL